MKHFTLFLSFLLLPVVAQAQTLIDGLYYTLDNSSMEAKVAKSPNPYEGEIVVPSEVVYSRRTYTVTAVGDYAFQNSYDLTAVRLPETVTRIESSAFVGCSRLSSLNIPAGLTRIGLQAFTGCSSLPSITIPGTVAEVESYAFSGCTSLAFALLGEGVTSIANSAFFGCTSMQSITLPATLTSIGSDAFYNCTGLEEVCIKDIEAWCNMDIQSNPLLYAGRLLLNDKELTQLTIPASVRTIGDKTFQGCTTLTSVTMPEGVTSIGDYAFSYCPSLMTVTFPSSLSSIGNYAFNDCGNLGMVTIPAGVTRIGNGTFQNCARMVSVTIPASVTEIGVNAFNECTSLTAVNITDLAAWCKIDFKSNPLVYARRLFVNGTIASSLEIPAGVTRISDMAFQGFSFLYSVNVPAGVTSIGSGAFQGCSFLSLVTLPEGLTSIEPGAFQGCSKLTNFYCYAATVPATAADAFSGASTYNATLYVPNGALSSYRATAPWSSFKEVRGLYPDLPTEKCAKPTIAYDKGELVFLCQTPGAVVTSQINAVNSQKSTSGRVKLEWAYEISFYASADGYLDSDVAKAVIALRNGVPVMEGFSYIALEPGTQRGDVNADGIIDVADIATIITLMAKSAK